MFWSQKRIWLAYRTGQNHARLPANPALPALQQIFSKTTTALSISCLSFDVRVGAEVRPIETARNPGSE
jgi:hypothetical protein